MFKKALITALALIGTQAISLNDLSPWHASHNNYLSTTGVKSELDHLSSGLPIGGSGSSEEGSSGADSSSPSLSIAFPTTNSFANFDSLEAQR